jgi:hypothetical protein
MNKKNCSLNKNPSEFVLRKALPVLGRVGWGLGAGERLLKNVPQHIFEAQTFAQTFALFN